MVFYKNWLNFSEYESLSNASGEKLAWEFLRRNEEYDEDQQKWQDQAEKEIEKNKIHFDSAFPKRCAYNFESSLWYPLYGKISEQGERVNAKYGISTGDLLNTQRFFVQPVKSDDPPRMSAGYVYFYKGANIPNIDVFSIDRPQEVIIKIDLDYPLDLQLDQLKKSIEKLAKFSSWDKMTGGAPLPKNKKDYRKRGLPKKHYIEYVRLLDALAVGEKFKYIAEIIYPDVDNSYPDYLASKRAEKAIARAKELMKSEYRFLPLVLK